MTAVMEQLPAKLDDVDFNELGKVPIDTLTELAKRQWTVYVELGRRTHVAFYRTGAVLWHIREQLQPKRGEWTNWQRANNLKIATVNEAINFYERWKRRGGEEKLTNTDMTLTEAKRLVGVAPPTPKPKPDDKGKADDKADAQTPPPTRPAAPQPVNSEDMTDEERAASDADVAAQEDAARPRAAQEASDATQTTPTQQEASQTPPEAAPVVTAAGPLEGAAVPATAVRVEATRVNPQSDPPEVVLDHTLSTLRMLDVAHGDPAAALKLLTDIRNRVEELIHQLDPTGYREGFDANQQPQKKRNRK